MGAVLIAGLLWGVGEVFYRLRGIEYLGLGDVKMVAMMMTFLGLTAGVMAVAIGSILGTIIGLCVLYLTKRGKDYPLPFGTFLAIGSLLEALVF